MKIKHKGKVYPSPSSSAAASSSSSSLGSNGDGDVLSVLKLLPAAILTLASVLSLEDREVLAYMITRSIKTTTSTPSSSSLPQDHNSKKKSSKSKPPNTSSAGNHKGAPIFDCDCFDCYTSYWFRWDSSTNRELIHQAIEAFEDHLAHGELSQKTTTSTRSKRRDKTGRRVAQRSDLFPAAQPESPVLEASTSAAAFTSPDDDVSPTITVDKAVDGIYEEAVKLNENLNDDPLAETEQVALVVRSPAEMNNRKGLVRKVLPDVLGILNSRLWSLWSPNV